MVGRTVVADHRAATKTADALTRFFKSQFLSLPGRRWVVEGV